MSSKKILMSITASVCLMSSLSAVAGSSHGIKSYSNLLTALDSGKSVRAVVHFDKCKKETDDSLPVSFSFGFDFDFYHHYQLPNGDGASQELISTSKTIFSISSLLPGPVKNYVSFHFFPDNTVRITAVRLDPNTNEEKMSRIYTCPLSGDKNTAGVIAYINA